MAAILDQKNYLEELNRHLKYDALHSLVFCSIRVVYTGSFYQV